MGKKPALSEWLERTQGAPETRRQVHLEEIDNGFLLTLHQAPVLTAGPFPSNLPGSVFAREAYRTLPEALARIVQFCEAEGKPQ